MRKILLLTAAMTMGFAVTAHATPIDFAFSAALSANEGDVATVNGSVFTGDGAFADNSIRDNEGVTQTNQNAGAGSLQQNSAAVASLEGIRIETPVTEVAAALSVSTNTGAVAGGANLSLLGVASAGMKDSVRDNEGVTQSNQNAGAGSLQQNSVALASIETCDSNCPNIDLAVTIAASGNAGSVSGLNLEGGHTAIASMTNSVRGNTGLTQTSQNAGAGSLAQNSIALASIRPRP